MTAGWVLVIILTFGNARNGSYTTTSVVVPGFTDPRACSAAAEYYRTRFGNRVIDATCVRVRS